MAGKPHVVIVEDSHDLANLFATMLRLYARVTIFERQEQFRQLLRPEAWEGVDAVLLDYMLGGDVTGLTIATFLKESCPEVRVVVLTAASVGRPRDLEDVSDMVLVKPEPIEAILAALRLV